MVERWSLKPVVTGSNPVTPSKINVMSENNLYPFVWKGKSYEKKDCGIKFITAYYERNAMREDGAVYFDSDVWVYPDGTMVDEEYDRNYDFIIKHQTKSVKSLNLNELIDKTLGYFIGMEDYEKCAILNKIKNNLKKV